MKRIIINMKLNIEEPKNKIEAYINKSYHIIYLLYKLFIISTKYLLLLFNY